MEIEKKLKDAREKAGLTQEQVAEAIFVSRQTISNWENGKSLPDITSVISLSNIYNISVDELLKGDQKLQKKIEKDANNARTNKRVIIVTAIITLVVLAVYLVSIFVGGAFYDFCKGAIIWVLLGIGIAFLATCLINRSHHNKPKFNKGAFKVKNLPILSVVLLLFAIWLSIFPIGQSSNLPEVASMFMAFLGLVCSAVSLFVTEK